MIGHLGAGAASGFCACDCTATQWVPSCVEPAENYLIINALRPRLAEAALVMERNPFEFDPRLA